MQVAAHLVHNFSACADEVQCSFCSAPASMSCEGCGNIVCHNDIMNVSVGECGSVRQFCYECALVECDTCQMCNSHSLAVTGCFACERRLCSGCRHSCSSDDCAHIDYCGLCWPDCLQQCSVCEQVRCNFDDMATCFRCDSALCSGCERCCGGPHCDKVFCEHCANQQLIRCNQCNGQPLCLQCLQLCDQCLQFYCECTPVTLEPTSGMFLCEPCVPAPGSLLCHEQLPPEQPFESAFSGLL